MSDCREKQNDSRLKNHNLCDVLEFKESSPMGHCPFRGVFERSTSRTWLCISLIPWRFLWEPWRLPRRWRHL